MDDGFEKLKKYNLWSGNTPSLGFARTEYTDKIYAYRGNRLIKVLTGQRRVGKSYLLR
jgi:predicted AAA+ superfamily ATPase